MAGLNPGAASEADQHGDDACDEEHGGHRGTRDEERTPRRAGQIEGEGRSRQGPERQRSRERRTAQRVSDLNGERVPLRLSAAPSVPG